MKNKDIISIALLICFPLGTTGQSQNWTQLGDFDGVGRVGAFAFVINNKGYIGAGATGSGQKLNDFWEYNPVTGAWSQKQNASGIPRVYAIGFAIGNKGYMGSGEIGSQGSFTASNDFYEYDPIADIWTVRQNIGLTGRRNATAFVIGNKGYVAFGYRDQNIYDNTMFEYNPSTNLWSPKASFDNTKLRESPASFSINGKGYIAGGYTVNANCPYGCYWNDIWEYNPTSNNWAFKANFPGNIIITEPVGFSSGNDGFIVGDDVSVSSDVNFLKFNPATNSVIPMPNHSREFVFPTGFILCDFAYTVTGSFGKEVWKYFLPALSITGPAIVCSGNNIFTLNNSPGGTTISWQATPSNLFTGSSGTGSSATLRAANSTVSGLGTITFTINTPCGDTPILISKTVWVGKPSLSSVTYDNESAPISCDLSLYQSFTGGDHVLATAALGASGYPTFVLNSFGSPYVHGNANGNNYNFNVNALHYNEIEFTISSTYSNACGSVSTCTYFTNLDALTSLFPNPSDDQLTLNLANDGVLKNVSLYNSNQERILTKETREKKIIIETRPFPNGSYILRVSMNGKVAAYNVRIKH